MKSPNELFEADDSTALLCIENESIRSVVTDQLKSLGFKMQSGLFREDVALRLQTHAYDLLVVSDGFEQGEGESNRIVMDCCESSPEHRRSLFLALIGPDFVSEDGMQAFRHSVDLVVATADVGRLAPMLRRSLDEHEDRYRRFRECAERAIMM